MCARLRNSTGGGSCRLSRRLLAAESPTSRRLVAAESPLSRRLSRRLLGADCRREFFGAVRKHEQIDQSERGEPDCALGMATSRQMGTLDRDMRVLACGKVTHRARLCAIWIATSRQLATLDRVARVLTLRQSRTDSNQSNAWIRAENATSQQTHVLRV